MTEITKNEENRKPRYSVSPIAFFFALILAPIVVTAFSFWTVIGLFALPLGIIPYLVIGTPILLRAVGRMKPEFGSYALLGLGGNVFAAIIGGAIAVSLDDKNALDQILFLAGFGLVFAPLYAGVFGSLYARFHPNIRILQPY